jgi:hypothetical protein
MHPFLSFGVFFGIRLSQIPGQTKVELLSFEGQRVTGPVESSLQYLRLGRRAFDI